MPRRSQHVVPSEHGWKVLRTGASRASSIHATQNEAIEAARSTARSQRTELYIHGRDGRIRERSSFSNDPRPSKK